MTSKFEIEVRVQKYDVLANLVQWIPNFMDNVKSDVVIYSIDAIFDAVQNYSYIDHDGNFKYCGNDNLDNRFILYVMRELNNYLEMSQGDEVEIMFVQRGNYDYKLRMRFGSVVFDPHITFRVHDDLDDDGEHVWYIVMDTN